MGQILETLYDVLFKPRQAFLSIKENPKAWQAVCVVVVNSLLVGVAVLAGQGSIGGGMKALIGNVQLIVNLLSWLVMTAIWHLIADLSGGKGQAKALLTAIGYTYFLQLLMLPVYLIASFLSQEAATGLLIVCGLAVTVWGVVLEVIAIQAVYEVSGAKAFLIFLLPVIALAVCILAFCILASIIIAAAVQGAMLPEVMQNF